MRKCRQHIYRWGFTLVELLVVISIISLLSSVVFSTVNSARAKARYARVISDFRQMKLAAELDADTRNGVYAGDLCPNTNPFPQYLSVWPQPPCSGWSYDWENWDGGGTIRVTMRDSGLTACAGSAIYYSCIFTTGNCNAGNGADINTVASKAINC